MQRKRLFRFAAATAGLLALLIGLTPAHADHRIFSDPNDVTNGFDIQQVRVHNGKRVVVTVSFQDLRRLRTGGLAVYFDTRGPDRGPEYRVAGGINAAGSDWQAVSIENWQGDNAHLLLRCDVNMTVGYRANRAAFDLARNCFRDPGRIRVAAVASGSPGSATDWAPQRHQFYPWVPR